MGVDNHNQSDIGFAIAQAGDVAVITEAGGRTRVGFCHELVSFHAHGRTAMTRGGSA